MEMSVQGMSEAGVSAKWWREKPIVGTSGVLQNWLNVEMLLDGATALGAAIAAMLFDFYLRPQTAATALWQNALTQGRSAALLATLSLALPVSLVVISRQLNLYTLGRSHSLAHEQRLSAEACMGAGLLIAGFLYLIDGEVIPRRTVLVTVALTLLIVNLRRMLHRVFINRRLEHGVGACSVLVVGSDPEAGALCSYLERNPRLGFALKGVIDPSNSLSEAPSRSEGVSAAVSAIAECVQRQFVEEVFVTLPCDPAVVKDLMEQARALRIRVRFVPVLPRGNSWKNALEYVGAIPTTSFQPSDGKEGRRIIKRAIDIVFSILALVLLLPLCLAIAVAIKLDSRGPILYWSERIGRKGRVFRFAKFRTMVRDAEQRRRHLIQLNERDGVLFKISNDPRITRIGKILRKYSLDEIPQILNVLSGDMSLVGPRPPLGSEVQKYNLRHLRRLDVQPGITGLWQVASRRDPSFDSYISCDMTYIENWSLWLDLKIIARTVGVVVAGTGS